MPEPLYEVPEEKPTPSDLSAELMAPAWYAFLAWAIGELQNDFEADTGFGPMPPPPMNVFEKLIDEACAIDGRRKLYLRGFVVWATVKHWGFDLAPKIVRDMITQTPMINNWNVAEGVEAQRKAVKEAEARGEI